MRLPSIRTWRRALGWGSLSTMLILISSFAFVGQTGCYGDQCIGDIQEYGDATHGELTSPDTWESNPPNSGWLNFSHKRTFNVHLYGLEGRDIQQVLPYISPDSVPKSDYGQSQYTLASGNLAEIQNLGTNIPGIPPTVRILNDTCADYYLRLLVIATPKAPGAAVDAGVNDAGADAIGDTGAKE